MPTPAGLITVQIPSPSPAPTVTEIIEGPAPRSCQEPGEAGRLYRFVCGITDNDSWAEFANDWVAVPFVVLVILLGAFLLRWLVHRIIHRLTKRAAEGTVPGILTRGRGGSILEQASPLLSERRKQRAETMGSVLTSIATIVIISVALLMALAELGLNIGPLLASAGILGVALGFGSQALVKDFLSGIFMILEDQYGVGDVVDLGEASGSVEAVGLRVTRLRSVDGTVWYVRNGEVIRVGNKSQGWARAVLDVPIGYGEDIDRVRELLRETADALYRDPEYADMVLEEPEVWGVEALSNESVVIRVVVKTEPLKQWEVARELRQRIKATFDEHGIEIPQPTVWMRTDGRGAEGGAQVRDVTARDPSET